MLFAAHIYIVDAWQKLLSISIGDTHFNGCQLNVVGDMRRY